MLEEAKKKSVRARLSFSDDLLADIAKSSLFRANSFPNDRPKPDSKLPAKQTLKYWHKFYLSLHQYLERETRVTTG